MSPPFRFSRTVEFADTDMAQMMHFSNFFRFMEAAECAFLRSQGLSVLTEWQGKKVSFPRVSASCDYLKPARFQEVVDTTVRVKKLGRSSVTYEFEFFKGEQPLARGQITAVFCVVHDDDRLEACEIPAEIRAKLTDKPGTAES
jgi:YbgC/YbaW family acyl-CoA thioester hydrolase